MRALFEASRNIELLWCGISHFVVVLNRKVSCSVLEVQASTEATNGQPVLETSADTSAPHKQDGTKEDVTF